MTSNLEYYKVFYYVAKCGGITAAAEKLSISQPAVSQSIRQLESVLGAGLFRRTSRGMTLTAEGELLYSYVAKGYEQIAMGEHRLQQMLHLDAGEVRVGASDMTLRFFLLPYLEAFHERYPNIKVTVTNGPTPETLHYLENDRIDFGIVSTPFETSPGIKSIEVMDISDTFIAGRRFTQYKNHMLDFQDLEKLPMISLEGNTSTRSYIDPFLRKRGVVIHPEFELATSDMIVQFALRNLGIGSVVRNFAEEYIESGILFELRFHEMIPKRSFCIVTSSSQPLSVAASRLLELIAKKA